MNTQAYDAARSSLSLPKTETLTTERLRELARTHPVSRERIEEPSDLIEAEPKCTCDSDQFGGVHHDHCAFWSSPQPQEKTVNVITGPGEYCDLDGKAEVFAKRGERWHGVDSHGLPACWEDDGDCFTPNGEGGGLIFGRWDDPEARKRAAAKKAALAKMFPGQPSSPPPPAFRVGMKARLKGLSDEVTVTRVFADSLEAVGGDGLNYFYFQDSLEPIPTPPPAEKPAYTEPPREQWRCSKCGHRGCDGTCYDDAPPAEKEKDVEPKAAPQQETPELPGELWGVVYPDGSLEMRPRDGAICCYLSFEAAENYWRNTGVRPIKLYPREPKEGEKLSEEDRRTLEELCTSSMNQDTAALRILCRLALEGSK